MLELLPWHQGIEKQTKSETNLLPEPQGSPFHLLEYNYRLLPYVLQQADAARCIARQHR